MQRWQTRLTLIQAKVWPQWRLRKEVTPRIAVVLAYSRKVDSFRYKASMVTLLVHRPALISWSRNVYSRWKTWKYQYLQGRQPNWKNSILCMDSSKLHNLKPSWVKNTRQKECRLLSLKRKRSITQITVALKVWLCPVMMLSICMVQQVLVTKWSTSKTL